jgi:hypothetical protein
MFKRDFILVIKNEFKLKKLIALILTLTKMKDKKLTESQRFIKYLNHN